MARLRDFFGRNRDLAARDREIAGLRREVVSLREENERMRIAMRRCLTCDYRLATRDDLRSNPRGSGGDPRFHGEPR